MFENIFIHSVLPSSRYLMYLQYLIIIIESHS